MRAACSFEASIYCTTHRQHFNQGDSCPGFDPASMPDAPVQAGAQDFTDANVIGLLKSTIGMCADEEPHLEISKRLWRAVEILYALRRSAGPAASDGAGHRGQGLINELEREIIRLNKEIHDWQREFNMWRGAWLREIGGVIRRKSWEIDGFVLRTRDVIAEAEKRGADAARAALPSGEPKEKK
jgi:hypothetical protein